jgi:HNH endonuclease
MRTELPQALAAGRRWYAECGRPAAWWEWEHAEPGRPTSKTISRRWGWHAFWAEVVGTSPEQLYPTGDQAKPATHRHLLDWSCEEMLEALMAAHRVEGRWPLAREWEAATEEHPARRTYVRRFGSWAAAIEAADKTGRLTLTR